MPGDARRVRLRAERGANRAAVVAAAESLLRERPFREVSIEELMGEAGLARTQFYRYFDDLPDLVLKVAGSVFEGLLGAYDELVEVVELTPERLREGIRPAVEAFAEHGPLIRAITEAAMHDAAVESAVGAVHERYVALTQRLVERAALGGAPITHPAQTARLLHMGNVAYLTDSFGTEPKVDAEVALDVVVLQWTAVLRL